MGVAVLRGDQTDWYKDYQDDSLGRIYIHDYEIDADSRCLTVKRRIYVYDEDGDDADWEMYAERECARYQPGRWDAVRQVDE